MSNPSLHPVFQRLPTEAASVPPSPVGHALLPLVFFASFLAHCAVLFGVSRIAAATEPRREPQVIRVVNIAQPTPPPIVAEKKPEPPPKPTPPPVQKKERPPRARTDERAKPPPASAPTPEIRAGLSDSNALPGSGSKTAPAAAQGNSAEVEVDPQAARNPPPLPVAGTPVPVDPDANPVTEASADEPARCPRVREIPITDDAANAGITSGKVVLEVLVGSTGEVREVKLRQGTGFDIDRLAAAEVRKIRCTPAKKGGQAVAQKRLLIEIPIEL